MCRSNVHFVICYFVIYSIFVIVGGFIVIIYVGFTTSIIMVLANYIYARGGIALVYNGTACLGVEGFPSCGSLPNWIILL